MLLSDYLAALRGGWKIILGVLVAALALAVVPPLREAPVYTSSTDLFIAAGASTDPTEDQLQRNVASAQRVLSYVAVASGDRAADLVAERVDDAADATVTAEAVAGTVVLRITATGPDAETVRDVAAGYAEVMPGLIDELEDVGDPQASQAQVSVIDAADLGTAAPRSLTPRLVLALVLGLGLGVGIVMVRETLRRELRETEREPEGDQA